MKLPAEQGRRPARRRGAAGPLQTGDTRYVLAARVTGPAETAFPDGPPKAEEPPAKPGEPAKSAEPAKPEPAPNSRANRCSRSTSSSSPTPTCSTTGSGRRPMISSAARSSSRSPTTAISLPTRSRCWAAARTLSGCAAAAPRRGRSSVVEQIQRAADDRYAAEQEALQHKLKQTQAKLRAPDQAASRPTPTRRWRPSRPGRRPVPRRACGDPARIARRAGGIAPGYRAAEGDSRILSTSRWCRSWSRRRRWCSARCACGAGAAAPRRRREGRGRCGNRPSCCCSLPRSCWSRPLPMRC